MQKIGGSIPAGRCVVLCGGSGCGKSTLLLCINGLIPQFYEGELKGFCLLNGQDTAGMRIGEIGELAASVFQDPRSQFFTVNSSNEVAFGLENHGLPQGEIRRRVDDTLSGVSFSVREHEIVGLVGANGCGKTTIGKLAALRNLHLPERLIMIVAVIFRFFPVLSGDMKLLRQSIRTRGAFATPLQKLRALPSYLEILTVPMALRVIRIAETLSASAETRGIDLKRRKSNYLSLRFSAWDVVFCVLLAAWIAARSYSVIVVLATFNYIPFKKESLTMSTATANKLKIKDIITVVLLALINVVIFFASSVLYATPITIILMPVFFALLEGIVYFIIGMKVKKPGAISHLQHCPRHYGRIPAVHHPLYALRCHCRAAAVEDGLRQCEGTNHQLCHQSGAGRLWQHHHSLRHRSQGYGKSDGHRWPSGYHPCRICQSYESVCRIRK